MMPSVGVRLIRHPATGADYRRTAPTPLRSRTGALGDAGLRVTTSMMSAALSISAMPLDPRRTVAGLPAGSGRTPLSHYGTTATAPVC